MNKIKKYGKHLFSVREIADNKLLKDVKCNSPISIAKAIQSGELNAFWTIRNSRNVYHIPTDSLLRFYYKRKRELDKTMIISRHKYAVRKLKTKKSVKYLRAKKYSQSTIAKFLGISRQRVNVISNEK